MYTLVGMVKELVTFKLPPPLRRALRERAAERGETVTDVLTRAAEAYVREGGEQPGPAAPLEAGAAAGVPPDVAASILGRLDRLDEVAGRLDRLAGRLDALEASLPGLIEAALDDLLDEDEGPPEPAPARPGRHPGQGRGAAPKGVSQRSRAAERAAADVRSRNWPGAARTLKTAVSAAEMAAADPSAVFRAPEASR